MRWNRLLSWLRPASRPTRRASLGRCRLRLEVLEDRHLLTTFTVVSTSDTGTGTGTQGDLRYCITQANNVHITKSDTIVFSPTKFATPQTITLNPGNGPLSLNDGNRPTLLGPAGGKVTISGADQVQVFNIVSGLVTFKNLTITHGNAISGGGIFISNGSTLNLTSCTLSHDTAFGNTSGGGIHNNGGTVHLTNCTFNHDSAGGQGGGLVNFGAATLTNCTLSNNKAAIGGGIESGGTLLTLTSCTLSNNAANTGGGIFSGGPVQLTNCTLSNDSASNQGGGGLFTAGTATLTNCTLSNNSTTGIGGGIWCNNTGGTALTLTNCTLSNNAAASGGGIYSSSGVSLTLTNTLIAENTAGNGPDIHGQVTTADSNLIGDGSGSTGISGGNHVGSTASPIDPRLGPLQNNGGPTQTLALLPGSLAIGNADSFAAPKTDQRGHVRNHLKPTDIGAFEH